MEVITKEIQKAEQLEQIDLGTLEFYRCGSADDGISLFCKKDSQIIYYLDKEQIPYEKKIEFMQKLKELSDFNVVGLGMGHFLRMKSEYVEEFNEKSLGCLNVFRDSKKMILEILSK